MDVNKTAENVVEPVDTVGVEKEQEPVIEAEPINSVSCYPCPAL